MSSSPLDEEDPRWGEMLEDVARKAGEAARKEAFAAGLPIVILVDGKVTRVTEAMWNEMNQGQQDE